MEKIELYKILTIENEDGSGDKDYTVANKIDYKETTYLYLIEVDADENLIESNQMITKLVIKEGEESLEKVTDPTELKEVARLFFELFKDLAKEDISNEHTRIEQRKLERKIQTDRQRHKACACRRRR